MKRLVATLAAFAVLAGCERISQERTFQTADVLCTMDETTVKIDGGSVVDILKELPNFSNLAATTFSPEGVINAEAQRIEAQARLVEATQELMATCDTMLSK